MSSSESALTMEMPELPDENIFEILSRLPVKSLMRFKCVSKPWCSLISDQHFIRAHFLQKGKFSSKMLLATRPHASVMDYEDCENSMVELNYPSKIQRWMPLEFVGSCDGLVCLLFHFNTFILWNPSTREARLLPGPVHENFRNYDQFSGFGYDSSIEDYKVVSGRWGEEFVGNDFSVNCVLEVFTLKVFKWKLIKFDNIGHQLCGRGIFLNGNLHWVSGDFRSKEVLLSFNMKEEKFMEVVPLPADCYIDCYQLRLAASENSLFLLILDSEDGSDLTVWKKSADVVENSWSKLYQVSLGFLPYNENWTYQLYITRYHKLLLSHPRNPRNSLAIYDLETMTHKDFPVTGMSNMIGIAYLESLVSPN